MARAGRRAHHQVTFGVLAMGVAAFALLQSLVIPVLTTVQHQLHTTQSAATWVLTAYLLSASIFTPIIDTQGNLSVSVRVDQRIIAALNVPGEFTGNVKNSENIGMSSAEMAAKWNGNFPDNLIELSQN